MLPMILKGLLGISVAAMLAIVAVAAADDAKAKVERGRYLVEEVGKCQDCHTPRLPSGEFDRTQWLKGAPIDFKPTHPVPKWEEMSPDITGKGQLFKDWGEVGIVKFLTTGKGPYDEKADAPMPTYKLKTEDAEAIVAYLKSIE